MNTARRKIHNQGFSLIEMMVVVIVLGILVSIAIPNYARSVERAKCSQGIQVLKSMRSAALSYFSDNQTFAGITVQDLETQIGARFFSTDVAANVDANENKDWYYSIAGTATRIQLQATRRSGPHVAAGNSVLTLTDDIDITADEKELWGGSYPWNDPANW